MNRSKEPAQLISTHQRVRNKRRNKIFVHDKEIIEQVELKLKLMSVSWSRSNNKLDRLKIPRKSIEKQNQNRPVWTSLSIEFAKFLITICDNGKLKFAKKKNDLLRKKPRAQNSRRELQRRCTRPHWLHRQTSVYCYFYRRRFPCYFRSAKCEKHFSGIFPTTFHKMPKLRWRLFIC